MTKKKAPISPPVTAPSNILDAGDDHVFEWLHPIAQNPTQTQLNQLNSINQKTEHEIKEMMK